MRIFTLPFLLIQLLSFPAHAARIVTNEVGIEAAPAWVNALRVHAVIRKTEKILEWDIRKVAIDWIDDAARFKKLHGWDDRVLAFTKKSKPELIVMGPQVDEKNYEAILAHELTHVVISQKYRKDIPGWLEEGLAEWVAHQGKKSEVDYAWIKTQTWPKIESLHHPFTGPDARLHYALSSALAEMLAKRCNLYDVLQMSVQRGVDSVVKKMCEIDDLNAALKKFVDEQTNSKK